MVSNRLAFAGLAVGCLAAAGGGGYLASRHDVAQSPVTAAAVAVPQQAVAPEPVAETETVVAVNHPAAAARDQRAPAVLEELEASSARSAPASARTAPRRTSRGTSPAAAPKPAGRAAAGNEPSVLERSWPSSTAQSSPTTTPQVAAIESIPTAPLADARLGEPVQVAPPPLPQFEELVVSANSVVGLQLDAAISSERAAVEDRVEARVMRDVRAGDGVAIAAGSRALGSVLVVERGGKFKERARLGIRFHTLVLADGTRLPITTETIYRYGDAPGNRSAAKIGGGAVAGAILGAIIGGAKGAAVGATAGAGGGTAAVVAGDRAAATFPAGAEVTARLIAPVTVTVEK